MARAVGRTDRLELLQGTLDLIVLQTLRWGPRHGHGIVEFVRHTSEHAFHIDHGSLYPALQRLLQAGLIKGEWATSPKRRRARYYRLTAAGRRRLAVESSRWERFAEALSRLLHPVHADAG